MPPPFSYAPARQDGKRMEKIEKARWIWLDRSRYPHAQRGIYTVFNEGGLFAGGTEYAVATFIGEIFCERAETLRVRSSADCKYILRVNGKIAMRGPLPVGGDYANESALGYRFCDEYDLALAAGKNEIRADVFLYPDVMTDYSDGHGGFYFEGWFSDGRTVCADESWLGYLNESYVSRGVYDAAEKIVPCRAKFTENIWHLLCAGLPALRYERIFPVSKRGGVFDFGRIYSCYLHARIVSRSEGGSLVFECFEKEGYFCTRREKVLLKRGMFEYDGTALCSARYVRILAPEGTSVSPALDFCRYPAEETGFFECSDGQLNEIYEACRHASAICRQGCHLDSPYHQEALGCTGDYYIESLMEHYLLSDRRLIRLDILRTARLLEIKGGKMFHTTYSLIFFEWVNDYLLFSGDRRILRETERVRKLVLARFLAHIDADGLCSMPDYLFVDWVKTGEFTLHHPPKAMGQAVLNAFLYRALTLFGGYETEAERLKAAFRQKLWDEERGLFFGGLAEREERGRKPLAAPRGREIFQRARKRARRALRFMPGRTVRGSDGTGAFGRFAPRASAVFHALRVRRARPRRAVRKIRESPPRKMGRAAERVQNLPERGMERFRLRLFARMGRLAAHSDVRKDPRRDADKRRVYGIRILSPRDRSGFCPRQDLYAAGKNRGVSRKGETARIERIYLQRRTK